ncbi:MAG: hypothetical protein HC843_07535 [Sphingomonadales bacterium]|nr:hypothetical protein [Sphingomonadales bacterium]
MAAETGSPFDLDMLHTRTAEVSNDLQTADSDRKVISEFLDAWANADNREDRD